MATMEAQFFFVFIVLVLLSVSKCFCQSFLNIEELSAMKYGIEITNQPVLYDSVATNNVMYVSSKFGQAYSCNIPKLLSNEEEEDSNDIDANKIVEILDQSFNGSCLTHNKGWWSYKVCHKKTIEQYHVGEKGVIEGLTLLGAYQSEDDWSKKDVSDVKAGGLYHSQNYSKGSTCDLTSQPRKTVVQYFCSAQEKDSIIRVEEPSTCEYIITIHSVKLCTHPLFKVKEKTKLVELKCSPALRQHEYEKYLNKMNKQKAKEEERKRELEEKLKGEKTVNDGEDQTEDDVLKDAANKANKILKSFMKPFLHDAKVLNIGSLSDLTKDQPASGDSMDDVSMDLADEDDASMKSSSDRNEDSFNNVNALESVAKDTADLDSVNHEIIQEAMKIRRSFNHQYAKIKKHAEKELDRSKNLLMSLLVLQKNTKTEKERKELEAMVKVLKSNIELFQKQIKSIDDKMSKTIALEKITESKLANIDKELRPNKDSESITTTLFTDQGDEEKEEDISNTISDFLKKQNAKRKTKHDSVMNQKSGNADMEDESSNIQNRVKAERKTEGKQGGIFANGPYRMDSIDENDMSDVEIGEIDDATFLDDVLNDEKIIDDDNDGEDGGSGKGLNKIVDLLKTQVKKLNKEMKKANEHKDNRDKSLDDKKKEDLKVRIRTVDGDKIAEELEKGMENVDETTKDEIKAASKQMEEAVKKQLKDAGVDFRSGIKIKIITTKDGFEKFGKDSKLLTDGDATKFKDMLLGFLGGGKDKISEEKRSKTLEDNYNFVWDTNDENDDDTESEIVT